MIELKLVSFTQYPGPRFRSEGDFSGEEWREEYLLPAFKKAKAANQKLHVDLDGVDGFASSFIEEAFGGLVRATGLSSDDIAETLEIKCHDEPAIVGRILGKTL